MILDFQDKGKYFRGLLILIGKDDNIQKDERKSILRICDKLGFESKFCDDAINEFFENTFIDKSPPEFSSQETAYNFLKDAIDLSLVDNEFHTEELIWLESVAIANGISNLWLDDELKKRIKKIKTNETAKV
ncbi:MAG: hypothetical protein OQJ81_08310 [Melioribacteraceae bacterium]|nr:hypothetical protein [Melioribacteraceae bacterium]